MKVANLVNGVDGSGKSIYVIQTIIDGVCTHIEKFHSLSEAKSWLEYACEDCDEKNNWAL